MKKIGKFELKDSTVPNHLFVEGVVILFGGMALTQDNKKLAVWILLSSGRILRFANSTIQHLSHCCLLNGWVKPFAVNIPIEDETAST